MVKRKISQSYGKHEKNIHIYIKHNMQINAQWNRLEYHAYHHQIGSMTHLPLFRVMSWNSGMCCMSFYILILIEWSILSNTHAGHVSIQHWMLYGGMSLQYMRRCVYLYGNRSQQTLHPSTLLGILSQHMLVATGFGEGCTSSATNDLIRLGINPIMNK